MIALLPLNSFCSPATTCSFCWHVYLCTYFYVMLACVALFMSHFGSMCSCLTDFCLLLICFCSFVYINFFLHYLLAKFWCVLTPTLCPILFCLFHVKQRWWFVSFMWPLFPSSSLFPFKRIDKFNPFFKAVRLMCLVLAKFAFLLCRSEGFCCDKSDSLTEQLSVIWLGDWLSGGQLNE